MAKFDFDDGGLAQPSSATSVTEATSDDKLVAILSTAGSAIEVNLASTNGTGTWVDGRGEDMEDDFLFGEWVKMPQDARLLKVTTSSGTHNVNVPTTGGFRTTHRTGAADGAEVYAREIEADGADA